MADTEESNAVSQSASTEADKKAVDSTEPEVPVVTAAGDDTAVTASNADTKTTASDADSTTKIESGVSPLQKKIIRQVEYYFGDANLDRDKFLNEEIKKDAGWVTLKTLLTFNRLKAMSEDPVVIMAALRKSSNDLLELKSDDSAIRRHPAHPVPSSDDRRQEIQQRLLYVKGFPTDQTLDDLLDYFDSLGGESVLLRHDAKKDFKGSIFILFKTAEQAKSFLEAPEMKYKDTPLILRLYKHDYYKKKQGEKLNVKQEEVKQKEEQKKKKEQEEKEEFEAKLTRGAVLKVAGLDAENTVDKIKEFFGTFGKIAWVDFEKSSDQALIRFATENEAKTAWEKAVEAGKDGKVICGDKELSATVMEGAEEETHWKKVFESIHNRFKPNRNKFGRGGHRGGQRGGYRGGHKRRNAGTDGSETTDKKAKAGD